MSKVASRENEDEKGEKWREWERIENPSPEYRVHKMTQNHGAQSSNFIKGTED